MIQHFRNVLLAAGVARGHLAEDPLTLFLQISRRLPAKIVQPASSTVAGFAPRKSAALPFLLADLMSGDDGGVRRRLKLALNEQLSAGTAKRLADVAIAAQLPTEADELIERAAGAKGLDRVRARRLWHDGAAGEAVKALAGSGRAGIAQRARLLGELRVLSGAAPVLSSTDFDPLRGRVLHLLTNSLPHTTSGYAQRSHSILAAQRDAGWEVLAVTRIGYPVQVGELAAKPYDVVDGIRYQRLLPARLAPTLDARLQQQAEELLKVVLDFRPSILHTTTHYVNALVVRAVARAVGIPWVYEVRGQLADTWASNRGAAAKRSERYRLFQEREAEVMNDADLVVTLGREMKSNIVATGVPESKVLISPNAVGGDYLNEPLDVVSARRVLGLAEGGHYIGTVSSLVAYEGIDCLIEAFNILAPRFPELRLLIVGDGASRPALELQARNSHYADRIIFTGRVPRGEAATHHQALDVFVVPRRDLEVTRSVTPLKPVEAMASGRPVVASNLPALQEIVTDGVSGTLVPADDAGQLADAVEVLLRDGPLRNSLGRNGRGQVLESRTWPANTRALSAAYRELQE